ncbi:hypothetical protein NBRC3278_1799 [Acetobacter pasteurianus NBRC 3278]|uniref:Uncharacterized protein n=1 Tax=Acetobacter pasteurianus NBRC 3278 TaxID=1226660 RepID=A0A401X4K8_ACEPA|nr:hypothetical protein [Acetobacter pasteurianus]GCD62706.1 hypothetical protein NBRC3278_1799 [Acetobacter pasteurianus NBRC 3278]
MAPPETCMGKAAMQEIGIWSGKVHQYLTLNTVGQIRTGTGWSGIEEVWPVL